MFDQERDVRNLAKIKDLPKTLPLNKVAKIIVATKEVVIDPTLKKTYEDMTVADELIIARAKRNYKAQARQELVGEGILNPDGSLK